MITKQERIQALQATGLPVYPNNLELIVNLTPHDILVSGVIKEGFGGPDTDTLFEIPASGRIARVETKLTQYLPEVTIRLGDEAWGIIPIQKQTCGKIVGLPAYNAKSGQRYIVSSIVLSAVKTMMPDRRDVFAPDTLNAVRDEDGKIISVPGFVN